MSVIADIVGVPFMTKWVKLLWQQSEGVKDLKITYQHFFQAVKSVMQAKSELVTESDKKKQTCNN